MDDRQHFERAREAQEARAISHADAALREARRAAHHDATRPELGRRAAAALPARTDPGTRSAVSGLAHLGAPGRSRYLLVHGNHDDAALLPRNGWTAQRAADLLRAGRIHFYATADRWFAALEQQP